jgi:hypothetical protein
MGYVTVFMEDYPIRRQLEIAASARDIVATHGAAMGLLVVNKSINSIIEICPPNVYHELFPVALGARIDNYIQIMPSFDINVACAGWPAILKYKSMPFALGDELLEAALGLL